MTDVEKLIEDTAQKLFKTFNEKGWRKWVSVPLGEKLAYRLGAKQILSGLDVYVKDPDQKFPEPLNIRKVKCETEADIHYVSSFTTGYSVAIGDVRQANFVKVIPLSELIKEVE